MAKLTAAWRRFRGWPIWAQVLSWIFVAGLVLTPFAPKDDKDLKVETARASSDSATSTTALSKAAEVTTTTEAPTTTTTAAPTTTTAPPRTTTTVYRAPATTAAPTTVPARSSNCDPNYTGCVPIASDVDCAGGSGNGPAYAVGPVNVIGTDIYDLDSDNDGIACE